MGQSFIYVSVSRREYFDPGAFKTDGKFLSIVNSVAATVYQVLTTVGMQPGGFAELSDLPEYRCKKYEWDGMLDKYVGRWLGTVTCVLGEYTKVDDRMLEKCFSDALREEMHKAFSKPLPLLPIGFVRRHFHDLTKPLVKFARLAGLFDKLPDYPHAVAEQLETYLATRLTHDWRVQRIHPLDLRWLHPHELESFLASSCSTLAELNKVKAAVAKCTLNEACRRVLEHFVWHKPPYYGILTKKNGKNVYNGSFSMKARDLAYGDWPRHAFGNSSLVKPRIMTPRAEFLTPDKPKGTDLRYFDLSQGKPDGQEETGG